MVLFGNTLVLSNNASRFKSFLSDTGHGIILPDFTHGSIKDKRSVAVASLTNLRLIEGRLLEVFSRLRNPEEQLAALLELPAVRIEDPNRVPSKAKQDEVRSNVAMLVSEKATRAFRYNAILDQVKHLLDVLGEGPDGDAEARVLDKADQFTVRGREDAQRMKDRLGEVLSARRLEATDLRSKIRGLWELLDESDDYVASFTEESGGEDGVKKQHLDAVSRDLGLVCFSPCSDCNNQVWR
jgi:hypothetical protein